MSQRDEIAQAANAAYEARLGEFGWDGDGKMWRDFTDGFKAAAAAGLLVPPGLTAEKLRHIANMSVTAEWCSLTRRQLLAWATSLDTQEER